MSTGYYSSSCSVRVLPYNVLLLYEVSCDKYCLYKSIALHYIFIYCTINTILVFNHNMCHCYRRFKTNIDVVPSKNQVLYGLNHY